MGIHKGADVKNWNVTFIKAPITKFYEENKNIKENKINKIEKGLNKNKKEKDKIKEKEKKIDNEDKKEKNNDNEIQNKIDYCILPENYLNYDLCFKVIVIGNYGKTFYMYFIYI